MTRVARELERMSLEHGDGDYLGGEAELIRRLGVSLPTFRQAARIVQHDRLIEVRQGIKGGFYAARPGAEDAVRTLARYLRTQGTTFRQVMAIGRLISEEAATEAARCADPDLRAELGKFAEGISADELPDRVALVRSERQLARLIADMSGNPVIRLFAEIRHSFGMAEGDTSLFQNEGQRCQARRLQRDLCAALLAGDADVAALMMRRRSALLSSWVGSDRKSGT